MSWLWENILQPLMTPVSTITGAVDATSEFMGDLAYGATTSGMADPLSEDDPALGGDGGGGGLIDMPSRETLVTQLLELIESGEVTPEGVAGILGLQEDEYDPGEFTMPTQHQLRGMEAKTYLPELTGITREYMPGLMKRAFEESPFSGGILKSKDKFRQETLGSMSPYRSAMQAGREGIQRNVALASSEIDNLISDWLNTAEIPV